MQSTLQNTLDHIKNQMMPYLVIVEDYKDLKPAQEQLIVFLGVIIQNLCFNAKNTHGYEENKEKEIMRKKLNLLKKIAKQENYHFFTYIVESLSFIFDGNLMSMEEESI